MEHGHDSHNRPATCYAPPEEAREAPPEELLYVAALRMGAGGDSASGVSVSLAHQARRSFSPPSPAPSWSPWHWSWRGSPSPASRSDSAGRGGAAGGTEIGGMPKMDAERVRSYATSPRVATLAPVDLLRRVRRVLHHLEGAAAVVRDDQRARPPAPATSRRAGCCRRRGVATIRPFADAAARHRAPRVPDDDVDPPKRRRVRRASSRGAEIGGLWPRTDAEDGRTSTCLGYAHDRAVAPRVRPPRRRPRRGPRAGRGGRRGARRRARAGARRRERRSHPSQPPTSSTNGRRRSCARWAPRYWRFPAITTSRCCRQRGCCGRSPASRRSGGPTSRLSVERLCVVGLNSARGWLYQEGVVRQAQLTTWLTRLANAAPE